MMLLAHASPQRKRHLDRFSRVFTDDYGVSLYWQWFACFPLKIASSHVSIWTSCNTWFIWPTRVRNANGNLIVSAVFVGLSGLTDWQSDRETEWPRYSVQCLVVMRNYVGYGKATRWFLVITNNFATIKSLYVRLKHFCSPHHTAWLKTTFKLC